jgi:hypothetical protein
MARSYEENLRRSVERGNRVVAHQQRLWERYAIYCNSYNRFLARSTRFLELEQRRQNGLTIGQRVHERRIQNGSRAVNPV